MRFFFKKFAYFNKKQYFCTRFQRKGLFVYRLGQEIFIL